MTHAHAVIDVDKYFVINPVTRSITNSTQKVYLMQNDHNSERVTFEIPRYIDTHDMSLCNKVEVHYINTDGIFSNEGIYEVEDLRVSPESNDKVLCSWLISQNATRYVGPISFVVRYACIEDSVIKYQWHTDIHSSIGIIESINNTEIVAIEHADILEQWRAQWRNDVKTVVDDYLDECATAVTTIATIENGVLKLTHKTITNNQ